MLFIEQLILNNFKDCLYNISRHSKDGGDLISYHPEKERIVKVIKKSVIDRYASMTEEEKKEKHGRVGEKNGMFGKKHSPETRQIISEEVKKHYSKNEAYNKGKKLEEIHGEEKSKEIKRRLSFAASRKIGSNNPFFGKQHTKEAKEKMSEKRKGKKPVNQRAVLIDGVEYESVTEASRQLKVAPSTIVHRMKSKNELYEKYFYKDQIEGVV